MSRKISPPPASVYSRQRGDTLIEALIAVLLVAILGLGLAYATSRTIRTQQAATVEGIVLNDMRRQFTENGVSTTCSTPQSISDGTGQQLTITVTQCTAPTSVQVSYGNISALTQTITATDLPRTQIAITASSSSSANSSPASGTQISLP